MTFDALTWAVAKGQHEGRVLLIRFRQMTPAFSRAAYPERINIFWEMRESDEAGLPRPEEATRLAAFEDRLVDAVEVDKHSILAVVLTTAGKREFVWQTTDVAGFLERLTGMPQEDDPYPIVMVREEDPHWYYFDSVTPEV